MATTPTLPDEIPLEKLTTADFNGTGVVDKLMQAVHSYINHEFKAGRLQGAEYAKVCLGLIQTALSTGADFLLQQQKAALEAKLIEAQIRLADKQVEIAEAELALKEAELPRIEAQVAQINAQTDLLGQQLLNAQKEHDILIAQECKLRAEYDLIQQQVLKAAQETALLTQKVDTERAQTQGTGVSPDSVIGRQMALYSAQASGFQRDAEQKAAKIMVDSWNVRRTTDEATQANPTNKLDDGSVGRAVDKLLSGVNA